MAEMGPQTHALMVEAWKNLAAAVAASGTPLGDFDVDAWVKDCPLFGTETAET